MELTGAVTMKTIELQCTGCGAIFTSQSETVPTSLQCPCSSKEFKVQTKTQ